MAQKKTAAKSNGVLRRFTQCVDKHANGSSRTESSPIRPVLSRRDEFTTHQHNTACLTPLLHGWLQQSKPSQPGPRLCLKWRSRGREEYSPSLRRPPALPRRLAAFWVSWSRAAHLHNTNLEDNKTHNLKDLRPFNPDTMHD